MEALMCKCCKCYKPCPFMKEVRNIKNMFKWLFGLIGVK